MSTSVDGLIQFIKADIVLEGDVLFVYVPKSYKMMMPRIKADEKNLLAKYKARKLRIDIKKTAEVKEVVYQTSLIDVKILNSITDELISLVNSNEYMALDFETTGLDSFTDEIISVGVSFVNGEETFYLPIAHNNAANIPIEVVMEFLAYASTRVKFVVHNLAFEKKFLDRYNVFPEYVDTMILTYLKGGLKSHGLKETVRDRLNTRMTTFEEVLGAKTKNAALFKDVELTKAAQYCGSDALYSAKLFKLLYKDLDSNLVKLDTNSAIVCSNMEKRGVLINADTLNKLRTFCELRKSRLEKLIYKTAGEEFNINSPKQLGHILYSKLGMTPDSKHGTTNTGAFATGAEAIDALIRNGVDNRILKHLKEYRNMVKLIGTYIERIQQGIHNVSGRYHPYFKFTGTDTGRLSSDFQQLPASGIGATVRKAVVPPKGFVVVAADYSQIELRLLAHLMQDENVNQMLRDGVDLHTATASIIFGIPTDQVDKDGPERARAKTMNFAIVYGRGDRNVALDLGISVAEAKAFKEKYFEGFPKLKKLIEDVVSNTRLNGYSETIAHRRRYLPDINIRGNTRAAMFKRAEAERQAFNAVIQGSAADLVRQSMPLCEKLANEYGAELVLQVHDEIVFYVPENKVVEFCKSVKTVMEVDNICGTKINVPIEVDVGSGVNYWEAK